MNDSTNDKFRLRSLRHLVRATASQEKVIIYKEKLAELEGILEGLDPRNPVKCYTDVLISTLRLVSLQNFCESENLVVTSDVEIAINELYEMLDILLISQSGKLSKKLPDVMDYLRGPYVD